MNTLYTTDLDGTLLDPTAHISKTTAKSFNELTAKGVHIAFVTARTPATVEPIASELHGLMPSVMMTGAAIWDFENRRYINVHYHSPADAMTISEICRRNGVGAFTYTLPAGTDSLQVFHPNRELTPIEHSFVKDRTLNDLKTFHLNTPAPPETADCTVLFFAMGEPQKMQTVADEIKASTHCAADWYPDTYNPGLALLEVFAPGVSKAAGLAELRTLTGAERIVAFGDNLNDIPMLRAADCAIAPANAHPRVKEIASAIIGPNSDDSVIRYIADDTAAQGAPRQRMA